MCLTFARTGRQWDETRQLEAVIIPQPEDAQVAKVHDLAAVLALHAAARRMHQHQTQMCAVCPRQEKIMRGAEG